MVIGAIMTTSVVNFIKHVRGDAMREFLVGLLVIVMALVLSGIGVLLLPLLLVLGIFFRLAIGLVVLLLAVWLIGKVTIFLIDALRNKENK